MTASADATHEMRMPLIGTKIATIASARATSPQILPTSPPNPARAPVATSDKHHLHEIRRTHLEPPPAPR